MTTHLDTACAPAVACAQLQTWLTDGDEVALLDVREPGQYGEGHPFFAVNVPYSRLEAAVGALVPRLATRLVLLDGGEPGTGGLAVRAAARLQGLGYTAVHRLDGGAAAWADSGRALFKGINVPSKTFGELVEHARHTPSISAAQLQQRLAAREPLLLVDGRTLAEHRKMTIPGAIPIPNGELAARIASVLPDAHTPVVVHCAGRTRSIIGAQILIDLGLPNPVYALENGTQGWRLAGFELEHGSARAVPPVALDAAGPLREAALARAARQAAPCLTAAQAQAWLDDPGRTTYVLDVRSAAEFAQGTLAGARHAPGGQLLQATDLVIGVRAARVLLLDGDGPQGLRAPLIASWLRQLGFEAATVEHGIHAPLRVPAPVPPALPALALIGPDDGALAARLRTHGHLLLDLRLSLDYRRGHAAGALWALRPRLDTAVEPGTRTATLISDDETIARLAAIDLREQGVLDLAWTHPADLQAIGHPTDSTPDQPSDLDAIDYLFFVHDRHDGNLDAARRYLEWETGLIAQCQPDEIGAFRLS